MVLSLRPVHAALCAVLLWLLLASFPAIAQPQQSQSVPFQSSTEGVTRTTQQAPAAAELLAAEPLLEATPTAIMFVSALSLLAVGLAALTLAQRRSDESAKSPLLFVAIGSFVAALIFLTAASSVETSAKAVALIPPSATGSQLYDLIIALGAVGALAASLYLSMRRGDARFPRTRRILPLVLGALGLLSYTNWLSFHPTGFVDRPGMYRSYLLAKYGAELGYNGLYRCTVKALSETRSYSGSFQYPDLWSPEAAQVTPPSPQMGAINACPSSFSTQRWMEFSSDVSFFDTYLGQAALDQALRSQLPTPSPLWALASHTFVRHGPPSEDHLALLAALDPILLAIASAAVVWAFGLDALCLAACFLGAFYPAQFGFTGGSLLTLDWLILIIIGLSLLRNGFALSAGFLLAWSALLKLFPVAFLVPCAVSVSASLIRQQKIDRLVIRAAAGALAACAVLIPLSGSPGGDDSISFPHFLSRSTAAISDGDGRNIGLATLLSFRPKDILPKPVRPPIADFVALPPAPVVRPEAPAILVAILALSFVGLWCWSLMRERRLWVLSLFGFAFVPFIASPSAASYALLVVSAFLVGEDRRVPLFLFVAACASQLVALASSAPELCYPAMSLVVLYFCCESVMTYRLRLVAAGPKAPPPAPS